jgi:hypothetical protein
MSGVQAYVVGLPERPQAVLRRCDRRILVGLQAAQIERHHHETPTAGRGHASEFPHGGQVVVNVLQHM